MSVPLLLAGALGFGSGVTDPPIPVVVTTDCGVEVDDQWTLLHLAHSDEVRLRGIVTTHAPGQTADAAAGVARDLLQRTSGSHAIPVTAGSNQPLAAADRPAEGEGMRFLLQVAKDRNPEDRLIVLILGAATDVASALIADPTWADRVKLVAMGFDGWPEGGDAWNVRNDVRAWQVVLESMAPLVLGDAAVCKSHLLMTREKAREILPDPHPPATYLRQALETWLDRHGEIARSATGSPDRWPIWDEVTTAHLLGLTRVERRSRPRLRDDLTFDHESARGTVEWITAIDAERLWHDLKAKLKAAPRSAPR
jgi:inosine-uridine nucleoside N-ribohydrolase